MFLQELKVKAGCCGCSLRCSSLFLGWFQLVGSVLVAVLMIILEVNIVYYISSNKGSEEVKERALLLIKCIYGALIASLVASGIISILLLYGIYKKKHQFMRPYVILIGIGICLQALTTMFLFFFIFINHALIVYFIKHIVGMAISTYSWMIVYSYYIELKEEKSNSIENPFNAA